MAVSGYQNPVSQFLDRIFGPETNPAVTRAKLAAEERAREEQVISRYEERASAQQVNSHYGPSYTKVRFGL